MCVRVLYLFIRFYLCTAAWKDGRQSTHTSSRLSSVCCSPPLNLFSSIDRDKFLFPTVPSFLVCFTRIFSISFALSPGCWFSVGGDPNKTDNCRWSRGISLGTAAVPASSIYSLGEREREGTTFFAGTLPFYLLISLPLLVKARLLLIQAILSLFDFLVLLHSQH